MPDWMIEALYSGMVVGLDGGGAHVKTLADGPCATVKHYADAGDWIIRGVAGELYPCKPEIFDATYEAVE